MSSVCKDCGSNLSTERRVTPANPVMCGLNAKSPDTNVEKDSELLHKLSIVGLKKYGVTTTNSQLSRRQWLQRALEESLVMVNYLKAAITTLDDEANT